MGKKTLAVKMDEDGQLYERFKKHEESHETKSEAAREALRNGLDDLDQPTGLVTGLLAALTDEWYEIARDSVLMAGVALILLSVISAYGPAWVATVATGVVALATVMSALAFLGAVAGVTVRLMDAAGYSPLSSGHAARDGERA